MFNFIETENNSQTDLVARRRFKAKFILGEYHSVQFFLNGSGLSHLFRLRYNTSNGAYILVKQDFSVFKELKIGDLMDMQYNRPESAGEGETFKTLITSKIPHDQYKGYSVVELSIINNQEEKIN